MSEAENVDTAWAPIERGPLQSQLESLGEVARGIAHDFSNLLMVISFSADLLRDLLGERSLDDGTDRAELLKNVDQIDRAVSRAANLTRQLSLLGQSEEGHAERIELTDRTERALES